MYNLYTICFACTPASRPFNLVSLLRAICTQKNKASVAVCVLLVAIKKLITKCKNHKAYRENTESESETVDRQKS